MGVGVGVNQNVLMKLIVLILIVFFFFQAEDGIRDRTVTGVQTCALPIFCLAIGNALWPPLRMYALIAVGRAPDCSLLGAVKAVQRRYLYHDAERRILRESRSEERRVGKECRSWWWSRE